MKNLQLIKSAKFGEIQADIYSDSNDMFMTVDQLAGCLEYASKSGVENILLRNEYLKNPEFSSTHRLWVDGKQRDTRVFTEDGIYEVTMLSSQPKAKEFRAWIRKVLKGLRKGDLKVVPTRRSLGEVNAAARIIRQTLKEAGMAPQFVAVAVKSLYAPVGVEIPLLGISTVKQTYDATAIAKRLGVMSKTGNPHGLAISAIISQLDVSDDEKELVPFQNARSGHSGSTVQYAESVISKVRLWLDRNAYPADILISGRSFKVSYLQKTA